MIVTEVMFSRQEEPLRSSHCNKNIAIMITTTIFIIIVIVDGQVCTKLSYDGCQKILYIYDSEVRLRMD